MRVAFADWFPCVFMRGTPVALASAFPGWRVPLPSPVRRRRPSPLRDGTFHEYLDWDPDPIEAHDAYLPPRPPLPYVEFRGASFWFDEYPELFSLLTDTAFDDSDVPGLDQMMEMQLFRPALYRAPDGAGEGLCLHGVPASFRDALSHVQEVEIESVARRWACAASVGAEDEPPPIAEKRVGTVRGLVELSKAAVKHEEDLFIWDDHH